MPFLPELFPSLPSNQNQEVFDLFWELAESNHDCSYRALGNPIQITMINEALSILLAVDDLAVDTITSFFENERAMRSRDPWDLLLFLFELIQEATLVSIDLNPQTFLHLLMRDAHSTPDLFQNRQHIRALVEDTSFVSFDNDFLIRLRDSLFYEYKTWKLGADKHWRVFIQRMAAAYDVIYAFSKLRSLTLKQEVVAAVRCSSSCVDQSLYLYKELVEDLPQLQVMRGSIDPYLYDHCLLLLPNSQAVQSIASSAVDEWRIDTQYQNLRIIDPTVLQLLDHQPFFQHLSYSEILDLCLEMFPNYFTGDGIFVGTLQEYVIFLGSLGLEDFEFKKEEETLGSIYYSTQQEGVVLRSDLSD